MSAISSLTSKQLIKAAKIKDQIAKLERELKAILGETSTPAPKVAQKPSKRKMSAAGKARIAAAQKARWAKAKAAKAKE